jgi:dipeptidase E
MTRRPNEVVSATQIKIAFGGGGEADDEHEVLEVFAGWVGDGRVLYLPIALDPPHEPHLEWAVKALGSVGITNVSMASSPDQLRHRLPTSDGVFIGGGNVYSLLHRLRTTATNRSLLAFAELGHPVYGGSAGALVLGRNVDTGKHVDRNVVGLVDATGLDLAFGYALWCHYVGSHDPLIHDYVNETGIGVLAIPERGGLARTAQEMRVLGPEPSRLFDSRRSEWLQPNDAVPIDS